MTSSLASPRARAARTVDELIAVEWDPEELFGSPGQSAAAERCGGSAPQPEEQDALIEAIAAANGAREAEVQAEVDRRVQEAFALGYEEGREAGEIAEGMRLRAAMQAAEDALDSLRAGEMRWTGALEENICALAVAVARQVVGRELEADPLTLTELVRRAVAEFPADQPLRIRVSAQDLALLNSAAGADAPVPGVAPDRETRWVADSLVAPGGCIVEGRERIVDGRVDNALERIYRRLTHNHA